MKWLKNSVQLVGSVHQEIVAMPAYARRKGWARVAVVLVIAACIAALTGCGKTDEPAQTSASDYSAEIAKLSKDRAKFKAEVVKCDQVINARMKAGDYSHDARCGALTAAFYSSSEHKGYKGGWPPGDGKGGQK
ncbi:hypothetical protein [Amphibiibacter pelophylacis]|uniref:Uncharacterized protein n=1 Tax=Amphibiibacter pelophylacis TaxID=1799477 RepID=A0ACC6P5Q4_9BURK